VNQAMGIDRQRIRGICFDVDGTLSDTDDLWVSRLSGWLKPMSWFFPQRNPSRFARWAIMAAESPGNLVYSLFDRFGLDDEMGRLFHWLNRQRGVLRPQRFLLISGVREALHRLHEHFPLAVVSARDHSGTLAFLRHFELEPLFHCVATSQTCEFTKPFPHPIRWAAAQMGLKPEELLMVGDTVVDIRAGKAAGAQTVGVLCGFGREDELRRAGADLILSDTARLADVLLD